MEGNWPQTTVDHLQPPTVTLPNVSITIQQPVVVAQSPWLTSNSGDHKGRILDARNQLPRINEVFPREWHMCSGPPGVLGLLLSGMGGGVWHKVLVVGSVSLWRRLLASRLWTLCYDKQASVLLRASALPRASTFLGGNPECNLCPWRPPLTA